LLTNIDVAHFRIVETLVTAFSNTMRAATALKPIMIVEIEIVVLQHEIFLYLIQHYSGWVHINSHEPGTFSIHRYRSRLTHLVQAS